MSLQVAPAATVVAGRELSLAVAVLDPRGDPRTLEPYLGMPAHGVVSLPALATPSGRRTDTDSSNRPRS